MKFCACVETSGGSIPTVSFVAKCKQRAIECLDFSLSSCRGECSLGVRGLSPLLSNKSFQDSGGEEDSDGCGDHLKRENHVLSSLHRVCKRLRGKEEFCGKEKPMRCKFESQSLERGCEQFFFTRLFTFQSSRTFRRIISFVRQIGHIQNKIYPEQQRKSGAANLEQSPESESSRL